jgi:hypothetical protein
MKKKKINWFTVGLSVLVGGVLAALLVFPLLPEKSDAVKSEVDAKQDSLIANLIRQNQQLTKAVNWSMPVNDYVIRLARAQDTNIVYPTWGS